MNKSNLNLRKFAAVILAEIKRYFEKLIVPKSISTTKTTKKTPCSK